MNIAVYSIGFAGLCNQAMAQAELGYTVLDLTITQESAPVTINEVPSDWPLTFNINVVMGPIAITLPRAGCDPATEGTYLRVYDPAVGQALVAELVTLRDTSRVDDAMEIAFPMGGGFAEGNGPQTTLYVDDPAGLSWDRGFNAFFEGRYAEVTADTVTLRFDRIEGAAGDAMAKAEPFILMVGRTGCTEFPAMPISLIAVNY